MPSLTVAEVSNEQIAAELAEVRRREATPHGELAWVPGAAQVLVALGAWWAAVLGALGRPRMTEMGC